MVKQLKQPAPAAESAGRVRVPAVAAPRVAEDRPAMLTVPTTRWGTIDVPAGDVITLDGGLLGLDGGERFVLVRPSDEATFFWLQSVERAETAMVVTDPAWFVAGYDAAARPDCRRELGLPEAGGGGGGGGGVQTLVVVNKVAGADGEWLTGNLMGPILVNAHTRRGRQVVLGERRWGMRQRLMKLDSAPHAPHTPTARTA